MRNLRTALLGFGIAAGLGLVSGTVGCAADERPVDRVPVPAPGNPDARRHETDRPKPLPEDATLMDRVRRDVPPPPFEDPPRVSQRTPEQGRFEQAYRGVGRPRITVFVNRTLDGEVIPAGAGEPERRAENPYLKAGEYDEANAKSLDYQAMESILTDFMACQGAIEIISPTTARQKLTEDQIKALQAGKAGAMQDAIAQLGADVLIQVTAHPTRQTTNGLEIRLVGEALNVKGGQQVGRAVVDLPAPLEKATLNKYTRFVARKLMMDMTQSWTAAEPPRGNPENGPAPKTPPADPNVPAPGGAAPGGGAGGGAGEPPR